MKIGLVVKYTTVEKNFKKSSIPIVCLYNSGMINNFRKKQFLYILAGKVDVILHLTLVHQNTIINSHLGAKPVFVDVLPDQIWTQMKLEKQYKKTKANNASASNQ